MPHPLFLRAIVLRAASLWFGVRMVIAFSGLPASTLLLPTGVAVSILVALVTVFLVGVEMHRRNEFLLLGSLGHAPAALLAISAMSVAPLEAAFSAIAA